MFSNFLSLAQQDSLNRARAIMGEELQSTKGDKKNSEARSGGSLFFRRRSKKRAQNFEKDYPALLVSLASAVRSGMDPVVALKNAECLFPAESEVAKATARFRSLIESGVDEDDAIMRFASDISHPDIDLFRSSFILARAQGSSLGDCLHRLARVTRQRQSFRRKTRAAVAMQKLSAIGIAGCAVLICLIQFVSNSEALEKTISHPVGFKILICGAALIVAGLIWMFNLASKEV